MADDKKLIDEQNVYIKDTLLSIAANYAEVLKDAVESAFDDVDAGVLKAVGNDLTRSFTKLAKLSDEFALNTNKIKKGLITQKDIEKQIQSIQEKRELLEKKIQHSEALGVKISEEDYVLALESLDLQEEQLEIDKKLAKSQSFRIGMQKGFNNLQKTFNTEQILSTFTVAGMFALIVDSALQFNKASVASGKLLGYSAEKANEMQSNFISIARSTGNVNITSKNLNEAFNQIAESTGYVSEYSEDALKTQIMLTKQFGLTGEEAAGIYKLSVLTGKSSSQVNDEMVGAFAATRNQLKVGVPFKATIAAAAKVSGQLAANLQNNPALITKAVVQASALGTTLEQTASQGEKLLDFSSSIESELKAELLTGKQLNLERARAAALAGDQVTLAQELNKNVGSLEDFQKMNVLQQKSLAEAVGLTSDQLAEQLKKQKLAQESGKSLAQITKEEALEAEKRQGVQDKFNAAVLKLQDFFGNLLAGPVGGFLEALTEMLPLIEGIGVGMGVWWTLSKGIALYNMISSGSLLKQLASLPAILGFKSTEAAVSTEIAVASITSASALTLGIGIAAVIAGIAAAVGAMKSMDDGVIGPGGETVVSGPKGSIQLNKNDSIVAGTNLFDKGKEGGATITPSIDLTPMISAINEVRSAVDRLYNKDTSISMDGKKVGTTLTQGSYKVA